MRDTEILYDLIVRIGTQRGWFEDPPAQLQAASFVAVAHRTTAGEDDPELAANEFSDQNASVYIQFSGTLNATTISVDVTVTVAQWRDQRIRQNGAKNLAIQLVQAIKAHIQG